MKEFEGSLPLQVREPGVKKLGPQRKFKKEYVLAKGVPVFSVPVYGNVSMPEEEGSHQRFYTMIGMAHNLMRARIKSLSIPEELMYEEVPKFELILRVVGGEK